MKQLKENYKNFNRTAQYFDELDRNKYIRMDGNESIDGLPKTFVEEVLHNFDANSLATYPNPKRCAEYIAQWANVPRESILVTNGSSVAIKMIFEIYADNGDRIVMTNPTFEMYGVYAAMYGAYPAKVNYNDDFVFPYDEFRKEIENGAKIAVIVNPDNPTGSALEQEKLLKLIETAREKGTIVIVDEAYFGYYNQTVIDKILLYDNLIVLRTFSKIMGLAGIRLGFVAANESIIKDIKQVSSNADANVIALKFGEQLMQRKDIWEKLVDDFKREKQYLEEKLTENHIPYIHTESNYVLIPCDRDLKQIYQEFKGEGILVACRFNKYIRINIGNENVTNTFINVYKKIIKC